MCQAADRGAMLHVESKGTASLNDQLVRVEAQIITFGLGSTQAICRALRLIAPAGAQTY
ncbi:MAG: hypothetical protein KAI80_08320 [Hyphomicrobiaceae bacterium]|nr:hypothetical protein [Hyphomicrobiaceae bacterium]